MATSTKKKPAEEPQVPEEEPVEAAVEAPSEPEPIIIIQKVYTERGVAAQVAGLQGKVEPTEVQTLLELAIKGWREQIGLAT